MTLEITPLKASEVQEIAGLSHRIWRQHYLAIISHEQIEFMLQQSHLPQHYEAMLEQPETHCIVARWQGEMVGFMVSKPAETPGSIFVNRLYVADSHRGLGIGRALLDTVSHQPLVLRVNRKNTDTIAFYQRYGFTIAREEVLELGNGFVMDDYIMACEPVR